ncbi:MAG TPA: fumarate reductase cytochrome b subunit, partial [Azonexus sp.]|nr:fumarate reductase cytochrome b subunit [Azonexus sp.]
MRQYAKPTLPPLPVEPDGLAPPSARLQHQGQSQALTASRWPARLDLLQGISGLALALFLVAHMAFVASILVSEEMFYRVARFFEGEWLFGTPHPWLVSLVAAGVTGLLIVHAWLALRKFPASYRQHSAFSAHRRRLRHVDTSLWWLQVVSGFILFFLTTIHLYDMLSQPALIGPYESADRVWSGRMWPIYLALLFTAEVHGGIGLYRLALKWGWFVGDDPNRGRLRLRRVRHVFTAFFVTL